MAYSLFLPDYIPVRALEVLILQVFIFNVYTNAFLRAGSFVSTFADKWLVCYEISQVETLFKSCKVETKML